MNGDESANEEERAAAATAPPLKIIEDMLDIKYYKRKRRYTKQPRA
jgi:hypothetical protein